MTYDPLASTLPLLASSAPLLPSLPPRLVEAGLSLVCEYLTEAEEAGLLALLDADETLWRRDLKRRVQHYGYRYDYAKRSVDPQDALGPLPAWADRLGQRLLSEGRFLSLPEQVIVNEYLPGQGISPHIDCLPCFGPTIASISLGSTCAMLFSRPSPREGVSPRHSSRPSPREGVSPRHSSLSPGSPPPSVEGAQPRSEEYSVLLPPRSLLVLQGESRTSWKHSIPARKSDPFGTTTLLRKRRVSLTFRTLQTPHSQRSTP